MRKQPKQNDNDVQYKYSIINVIRWYSRSNRSNYICALMNEHQHQSTHLGNMGYSGKDKTLAAERLSSPGWAVEKPKLRARSQAAPSLQVLKQGEGQLPIADWLAHGHWKIGL